MLNLTDDDGWDDEIIDTPSRGYKELRKRFTNDGLVARYKSNTYIYIAATNSWSIFISAEAQRQICDATGGENASVSYLGASLPYFKFLQDHAIRTGSIPVSICIGTRRLAISKSGDGIELTQCSNITSVRVDLDDRVQGFCFMPSSFNQIPRSWSPGGTEKVLKFIQVLFLDPVELHTVMWSIGLMAVDPSSISKFLLLYGPGGTGKSTLVGLIEDLFVGCCGTIPSGALTAKSSNLNTETARIIASNRVVTAGDIDLETSKLNLHVVKEVTGHDSISVPPIKIRTRCSLVAASNDLPHPRDQPTWCTPAVARRTFVIPMNIKTSLIPNVERPDMVEDLIDFLLSCTKLHLDYQNSPPISFRCMMFSILGSGYLDIQGKVAYDPEADEQSIIDANTAIETLFNLEMYVLGELALLKAPDWVVEYSSNYFIKGLILLEDIANTA